MGEQGTQWDGSLELTKTCTEEPSLCVSVD